ncbi:MAG: glycoside hydrolase family 20 zincin-like fold domain-containing protein [Ginsengibacter sp.]
MKIRSVCFTFIFIFLVGQNVLAQKECPIIPLPNNYESTEEVFLLNKNTSIGINDTSLHSLAVCLQQSIKNYNGVTLKIGNRDKSQTIFLEKTDGDSNMESYSLKMSKNSIVMVQLHKKDYLMALYQCYNY